jgi:hypothetical protein
MVRMNNHPFSCIHYANCFIYTYIVIFLPDSESTDQGSCIGIDIYAWYRSGALRLETRESTFVLKKEKSENRTNVVTFVSNRKI